MKIAITGGTGFAGRHLARALVRDGHAVVLIARGVDARDPDIRHLDRAACAAIGTSSVEKLTAAFAGCEAVAHCAGINRAIGEQTHERVHRETVPADLAPLSPFEDRRTRERLPEAKPFGFQDLRGCACLARR